MPKLSVSVPDDLWERARRSSRFGLKEPKSSQVVQDALHVMLREHEARASALASTATIDSARLERALRSVMAGAVAEYERGYHAGLELAEEVKFEGVSLVATEYQFNLVDAITDLFESRASLDQSPWCRRHRPLDTGSEPFWAGANRAMSDLWQQLRVNGWGVDERKPSADERKPSAAEPTFTPETSSTPPRTLVAKTPRPVSAKAHGDLQRRRWAASEASSLRHDKGQIFRSGIGRRVGIAFATERYPNKWFLGLPADAFDEAILLCEEEDGTIHALHLDTAFLAAHGQSLSSSGRGIKFNVYRSGNDFSLGLSGRRRVPVNTYRGTF